MSASKARQEGYFDEVYSIFEAHDHPIVLVEDTAMRWMGLRLCIRENLDLLVRDSQIDSILNSLLKTNHFELVHQDLNFRLNDPYTKQVPRLRDMRCEPAGTLTCVNLWSETVYHLRVDDSEPVAVADIHAWNAVLAEERFGTVPETASLTITAMSKRGTKILPIVMSSTGPKRFPVFVPSIPRICDAILDQLRYRTTHAENSPTASNRPSYHLSNLVRYLYLERSSQLDLLLSQVTERNRAEMKKRAKSFKRKPTLAQTMESMGMITLLR